MPPHMTHPLPHPQPLRHSAVPAVSAARGVELEEDGGWVGGPPADVAEDLGAVDRADVVRRRLDSPPRSDARRDGNVETWDPPKFTETLECEACDSGDVSQDDDAPHPACGCRRVQPCRLPWCGWVSIVHRQDPPTPPEHVPVPHHALPPAPASATAPVVSPGPGAVAPERPAPPPRAPARATSPDTAMDVCDKCGDLFFGARCDACFPDLAGPVLPSLAGTAAPAEPVVLTPEPNYYLQWLDGGWPSGVRVAGGARSPKVGEEAGPGVPSTYPEWFRNVTPQLSGGTARRHHTRPRR